MHRDAQLGDSCVHRDAQLGDSCVHRDAQLQGHFLPKMRVFLALFGHLANRSRASLAHGNCTICGMIRGLMNGAGTWRILNLARITPGSYHFSFSVIGTSKMGRCQSGQMGLAVNLLRKLREFKSLSAHYPKKKEGRRYASKQTR